MGKRLTNSELNELLSEANAKVDELTKQKVRVIRKGRIEDEVEIARLGALVKELRAEILAGPDVEAEQQANVGET